MLPTFLVIGAPKAGTTALHSYLRRHPQVVMARPKELMFFVEEANWGKGLDWYEQHFVADRPGAVAFGESSPDYARCTVHTGVPQRIADVIPDVRLIYLVRDPLERIRSHYQHAVSFGVERRSIDDAVRAVPHYVDDSRYMLQIDRFLEVFPADRILVVSNDALRHERRATLGRVAEFVGVDPERFSPADISVERYTSEGRTAPPGALAALRQSKAAPALRRVVPGRIRRRVWHQAGRTISAEQLRLSPATVAWVRRELADDRHRLAEHRPDVVTWPHGN